MVKIHWLGAGLSAIPGLKKLIENGHSVIVYNRTVEKASDALLGIEGNFRIEEFSLEIHLVPSLLARRRNSSLLISRMIKLIGVNNPK